MSDIPSHPNSLANLVPPRWRPGKTAYQQPKALREVLTKARRSSMEVLDTALDIMRDSEQPAASRLGACAFVWERAWGTTKQELEGAPSVPALRIEFVTADQQLRDVRVIEHESNSPKFEEIRDADAE